MVSSVHNQPPRSYKSVIYRPRTKHENALMTEMMGGWEEDDSVACAMDGSGRGTKNPILLEQLDAF